MKDQSETLSSKYLHV